MSRRMLGFIVVAGLGLWGAAHLWQGEGAPVAVAADQKKGDNPPTGAAEKTKETAADPKPADAKNPKATKPKPGEKREEAEPKPAKPKPGDKVVPENPFPNRQPAPGLEGGTEWLNVGGPIALKDLKGKVVLLDFWTYCCINCMHILPDLKYLEKKYPNELVVIGVHSAKFDNEKDSENIRKAILRYEIEHPVINDSEMVVWRKFGVRAWPWLVMIDPEGQFCGYVSGEGNRELLDLVVQKVIDHHKAKGTLDTTPVNFALERNKVAPTPLRFPGKVLADEKSDRLFISDSNNNRIVITSLSGKLKDIIGTGAIGKEDGAYDKATFDHPQGMALVGETLFVADTENHLIRAVDLAKKMVVTIAGTGEQARGRGPGGELLKTELNSPWDLVHVEGKLYIAMAGPHQIWVLDFKEKSVEPFAGSGREDILNGPLMNAALAQPSGITTDGKVLYVVDSEGSSVRKIELDPKDGEVSTIVGTSDLPQGRCLFEFGDKDGVGDNARLQHPLGIVYHQGGLFVADSYNHKIKKIDLKKRDSRTYLGDGKPGAQNDKPRFSEPAGLTVAGTTLYVADTNNHLIRTVDLQTGKVSTLSLEGLNPPAPVKPASDVTSTPAKEQIKVEPQRVAVGNKVAVEVTLSLPEGYKLNKEAPLTYRLQSAAAQSLVPAKDLNVRHEITAPAEGNVLKFDLPLSNQAEKAELLLTVTYGYCRAGTGGLCKLGVVTWNLPIETAAGGDAKPIVLKAPAAD